MKVFHVKTLAPRGNNEEDPNTAMEPATNPNTDSQINESEDSTSDKPIENKNQDSDSKYDSFHS